jgi:inorganic triphosphatase YgiF
MPASREIELKLEIEQEYVLALRQHPLLAGLPCVEKHQRSVYFDSGNGQLRKAGLTLRIREGDGEYIQTVKADEGRLFDRAEWEKPIDGANPDMDMVARTPLGEHLGQKALRSLQPIFETLVDRSAWQIAAGEDEVEIVLDQGKLIGGQASAPIMELELELKRGGPRRLFSIAYELNRSVPLRLGVLAKSERGHQLLDGRKRAIVKAAPIALSSGMSVGNAFRTIAFACVRHFRLNEPLFVHDRESAALHQARVAMRRLRSAMSLFAPIIAGPELEPIGVDLRWISNLLGAARDLDVFVQKRLDPAGTSPDLWTALLDQREAAFDEAIAALNSERFRALMISLVQWIETGQWIDEIGDRAVSREQPIGDFAVDALDRLWRKVRKRGRHLARLEDEERHRLRIAAKKLRYASEFFAALFGGKKRRARCAEFGHAMEDMQEQLGALNDLATALSISARIAGHIRPRSLRQELMEAAVGAEQGEKEPLLTSAEKAYRKLAEAGPFWR